MPAGYTSVFGPEGQARSAAQQVQFNLTEKGADFLGYKTLKALLGSVGKSSAGAHDTPHLATGIEAEAASKPYEFGDTLNLDVPATLGRAIAREGLDGADQPRVQRPDGAPVGVPLLRGDGADAGLLALDDPLRRGSLHAGQEGGAGADAPDPHPVPRRLASAACCSTTRRRRSRSRRCPQVQVGPYHTNTAEGLKLARRILIGAEEGHAADHHDHRRQALRDDHAGRAGLREFDGARPARSCRRPTGRWPTAAAPGS